MARKKRKRRAGWKGTSGLTYEQHPQWKKIRLEVLRAYGHQCAAIRGDTGVRCTARATHVDHIDGHSNELHNLQALCAHHHQQKTSAETAAKSRAAMMRAGELAGEVGTSLLGKKVPLEQTSISSGIDWGAIRDKAARAGQKD